MNISLEEALQGLEQSRREGVNILIDVERRRALYPDLQSMKKRTSEIALKQAQIPIADANQDIEHLLYHIDMLKKELRKHDATI